MNRDRIYTLYVLIDIHTLVLSEYTLVVDANQRPSISEILQMDCVLKRIDHLIPKRLLDHYRLKQQTPVNQTSQRMIATIKVPRNLVKLTENLPGPCYPAATIKISLSSTSSSSPSNSKKINPPQSEANNIINNNKRVSPNKRILQENRNVVNNYNNPINNGIPAKPSIVQSHQDQGVIRRYPLLHQQPQSQLQQERQRQLLVNQRDRLVKPQSQPQPPPQSNINNKYNYPNNNNNNYNIINNQPKKPAIPAMPPANKVILKKPGVSSAEKKHVRMARPVVQSSQLQQQQQQQQPQVRHQQVPSVVDPREVKAGDNIVHQKPTSVAPTKQQQPAVDKENSREGNIGESKRL